MDYKITLFGNRIYKEIKLGEEFKKGLLIGTTKACQIRFLRDQFFADFVVRIQFQAGQWIITCEDSVHLKKQNMYKEYIQKLEPQDIVSICYDQPDIELFKIEFGIDFGDKTKDYNCRIQCSGYQDITIGGTQGCTIQIPDILLAQEYIRLIQNETGYMIYTTGMGCGLCVNGFRCREQQVQLCNMDFFSIAGYSFYYKNGYFFTSEAFALQTAMPKEIIREQSNHLQYPKFIRSARQQFEIPDKKIDILPPKAKMEEPKKNLVMTMVPMLVSMGMMVMLRTAMGGNKMFIFMCIGMGTISAVMSVINYRNEGLQYRKNIVKRENDYNKYMAEQEEKICALREKEKIISLQKYPSLEEHIQYAENFDARLFEKLKEHEDYLSVRLGAGTVEAKTQVGFREQEYRETEDPLMDYPEKLHDKYQYIDEMPVVLELKEQNAVGFIGDRSHLYQMAKNLILMFATEHYYQDMKFFILMQEEDKPYFEWARWFRNASEDNGIRNFMYDDNSSKVILEYLYAELSNREKMKDVEELSTYVVFVYRSDMLGNHPIIEYVEHAAKLGFVFLFFEEYVEKMNQYVAKRVFLHKDQFVGYVQDIHNGEQIQPFTYPHVTKETALQAALKLACVYVDEVSLESSLTKNITLYELFHILNAYDLQIEKRWKQSKIYDSMAAPIGVKSGDEVVYLDLHEKFHGPHGLVAGTTGSGKSEILQTYILAMATLFHPYEVGFIIIDFKGGGMVNQFRDLPHLNGAITNIDGNEINRSLASIKAELQKRQRYFAEYDVNHIDDYIRLYKNGVAKNPLPHLILIVDEFAELKSEQPEFMKELISAARIGRSLGVHLILATQKPSGVVNDQIWSNSKFKLCLKVQNKSDSNEVLKSPLAAEIREPGRAYLQVGNNEIFQLFQSAYSGAPIPNSDMGDKKKFKIAQVDLCGARQVIYEQKPTADADGVTQLDAIVDYIHEYCEKHGIDRLPNICLPSLPELIPYTLQGYQNNTSDICVPIGMYDDPANQKQDIMDINFTQGHVFIVGSSLYGKTNLLQTMIRGLAEKYSSDEVQLYILDFASMILKNFTKLKHVGGVITSGDDEKMKVFMKMMREELESRKKQFAEMGLSSYSSYLEADQHDMPQIIIMIDNMGGLRELYAGFENDLLKLSREGTAVGICMVITSLQTSNAGYKYLSNIPKKIALYCNNSSEYTSAFERCRMKLNPVAGRCIIEQEKELYEGQIYVAFPAEKEIERVGEIRTFIKEINQKDKGKGAKLLPMIPELITEEMVEQMMGQQRMPYSMPIGMNFSTMEIDDIILEQFIWLGICGERGLGRTNYICYMIQRLLKYQQQDPVHIRIIDSEQKRLQIFAEQTDYTVGTNETVEAFLTAFKEEMERRLEIKKTEGANAIKKLPLECIILNARETYQMIDQNEKLLMICKDMVKKYKDLKLVCILSDLEDRSLLTESSEIIKIFRINKNILLFKNIKDQKLLDVTALQKKTFAKELLPGEAFFRSATYMEKFRTPFFTKK